MYAGIRIGASVGFTFFGLISPLASHLEFNVMRENSLTRKIYNPTTIVVGTLFNAGMGAFTGSLIGGGIALVGLKVTKKDEEIEEKFVRGSKFAILQEAQALISLQEKKKHYPRIRIGKLQMASTNDYGGYLLIGKPGTGKSLVLREIVEVLHERMKAGHRVRAIVLDSNGDFISTHYRPGFDLIFNPDDARSIKWSHSCEPEALISKIANSLVPTSVHGEPFWTQSAQMLLADMFSFIKKNSGIWKALTHPDNKNILAKELGARGLISVQFFNPNDNSENRTLQGIMANLPSNLGFYKNLPDPDPDKEMFSFFRWGKANTPDNWDGRWIYLPRYRHSSDTWNGLHRVILNLVIQGLLSNETDCETWVIADEFPNLGKIESIPTALLPEGRKSGGFFVGAIQVISQLERNYGRDDTETILATLGTKIVFNTAEPDSANRLSKIVGTQEVLQLNRSYQPDGETVTGIGKSLREKVLIHPSEIMNLQQLKAYVISPGAPTTMVSVPIKKYKKINANYVSAYPEEIREVELSRSVRKVPTEGVTNDEGGS